MKRLLLAGRTKIVAASKKLLAALRLVLTPAGLFTIGIAMVAGAIINQQINSSPSHIGGPTYQASSVPTQEQADAIFKKYLIKYLSSNEVSTEETVAATPGSDDSTINARAIVDAKHGKFLAFSGMNCKTHFAGNMITVDASVQIDETGSYMRVNEIAGVLTTLDGKKVVLSSAFTNAIGTWYKISSPDQAMQVQSENGVYVFNSGVIAPSYNANKVASALLKNKVYDYSLIEKVGGKYIYSLSAKRDNYKIALQQAFPSLSSVDEIIGLVFSEGETAKDSTLTLLADGTLVQEELTEDDQCAQVITSLFGSDGTNNSNVMKGISVNKSKVKAITPIKSSKPLAEISADISF